MQFSELIYNERVKRKWSVRYVADCIEVSHSCISSWENTKGRIPLDAAIKLVELYDINYNLNSKTQYKTT